MRKAKLEVIISTISHLADGRRLCYLQLVQDLCKYVHLVGAFSHRIPKNTSGIEVVQNSQQAPPIPLVGYPATVRDIPSDIHQAFYRQGCKSWCRRICVEIVHESAEKLERRIQVGVSEIVGNIPA